MLENFLIVGSPDTVVQKLEALYETVGGFGTVVSFAHEYNLDPEPYRRNFELIGTEVKPRLAHLQP
jgi:alkanesulfonate monooxygenase SsuD/methylene tetrahydromethanopterin reductase-like flavin-dependent oxidoreductase (luciferase family)